MQVVQRAPSRAAQQVHLPRLGANAVKMDGRHLPSEELCGEQGSSPGAWCSQRRTSACDLSRLQIPQAERKVEIDWDRLYRKLNFGRTLFDGAKEVLFVVLFYHMSEFLPTSPIRGGVLVRTPPLQETANSCLSIELGNADLHV